jgi:hypothetical protein
VDVLGGFRLASEDDSSGFYRPIVSDAQSAYRCGMKPTILNISPLFLIAIILALGTLVVLKLLADSYGFDLPTALTN